MNEILKVSTSSLLPPNPTARLRAALGKLPVKNAIIDGEIICPQHIDAAGKEFFNEICRCDLEGIVAKRKLGMYREDRLDWLKIKKQDVFAGGGKARIVDEKNRRQAMMRAEGLLLV